MKKSRLALLLSCVLMLCAALPAYAAAPKVREIEYEGNGVVEFDFKSKDVQYRNLKVTVKDGAGKSHAVTILEADDDLTFKVDSIAPATRYSVTIKGIRDGGKGEYGQVKGSFKTPSKKPSIEKVEYDAEDRELEIEFATKVQFKNPKVTVKDAGGEKLNVSSLKKGSDDIEVRVRGMKRGKTYTVTVSGVRVKGTGSYTSVSKKVKIK